jgi:hypothetical protein
MARSAPGAALLAAIFPGNECSCPETKVMG